MHNEPGDLFTSGCAGDVLPAKGRARIRCRRLGLCLTPEIPLQSHRDAQEQLSCEALAAAIAKQDIHAEVQVQHSLCTGSRTENPPPLHRSNGSTGVPSSLLEGLEVQNAMH